MYYSLNIYCLLFRISSIQLQYLVNHSIAYHDERIMIVDKLIKYIVKIKQAAKLEDEGINAAGIRAILAMRRGER